MGEIITLKENREFKRMYSRGKSFVSPIVVTYAMRNRKNIVRIGITTSKKVGNAVLRNRARRIILSAFRKISPDLKLGYDFVFVARAKTPFAKSDDIFKYMKVHFKKLGVLNEKKWEFIKYFFFKEIYYKLYKILSEENIC